MEISELTVWSAMLGGLLTLSAVALAYVAIARSPNSVRYLVFVVVTGSSSLLRTGLVETLIPAIPLILLHTLKVCAGPLSAALVLKYLGVWLGGKQQDPVAYRITNRGSMAMLLSGLVLGLLVQQADAQELHHLLEATALVTVVAVALGLYISIRAALLGDPLARWVVLAGVCLAVEVWGLYVRSLDVPGYGLGTWILTATCTVAYFLVGSIVVIGRLRQTRRLERLARLAAGADPATGLPVGSVLLADVEHAFWRATRLGGECTVVCLHLGNLYALSEPAGRGVEHQILVAMAARIRQAAGFRCIVGLYHPRCFVVVISAYKRPQYVGLTISRLRSLAAQPLSVVGNDGKRHDFLPSLGVGVVKPDTASTTPMDAINEAEQKALRPPLGITQDDVETVPGLRLADTAGAPLQ